MKRILSIISGCVYSMLTFCIMSKAFDHMRGSTVFKQMGITVLSATLFLVFWFFLRGLCHVEKEIIRAYTVTSAFVFEGVILIFIFFVDGLAFLFVFWKLTAVLVCSFALFFLLKKIAKWLKDGFK